MNSNHILIVWMPGDQISDDRAYRDYVLESVRAGVLVLPADAACEVMELSQLGDVEVVPGDTPSQSPAEPATAPPVGPSQSPAEPVTAPPEGEPGTAEGAEKRAILRRLTDYRAAHGLGSLDTIAKATRTRGRINDNTLRMLLTGDAQLPVADWRRIGRALDRLEAAGEAGTDG